MGIIGSNAGVSFDPTDSDGAVFGTFGAQYDASEFEREREDGFTVIGMSPDCRVFIYGADVTADVRDVSVSNSMLNGNKCEITLTNPRGKYEITKQDLMGKWREDKDILAAYTYPELKRVSQKRYESVMDNLTTMAFGKKVAGSIQQGMNLMTEGGKILGNPYSLPSVRGVTRQVFETKFFSGLTKNAGDIVFDYRDPVYVFFKGRFAPFWYFGFTGIVTGWDDADAYQESQTIRLRCEDITSVWRRAKFSEQNAMFQFSRREDRFRTTQASSAYNIFSDIAGAVSFSDLIKLAAFSYDYGKMAYNCHISKPGRYVTEADQSVFSGAKTERLSDSDIYREVKGRLRSQALMDSGILTLGQESGRFQFTQTGLTNGWGIDATGNVSWTDTKGVISGNKTYGASAGSTGGTGLVDISKIKYVHPDVLHTQNYKLNESSFGPSVSLYLQFNEIEFPYGVPFTGKNLKAYLDVSVRYWEAQHRIREDLEKTSDSYGTGWRDNKAFGICGAHPALTYEFLSNFGTLNDVWEQCYKKANVRDKLVMSPNDKIRAMAFGEPTEMTENDSSGKPIDYGSKPAGTAFNLFRPRLFVVLPRRFSDRYKKAGTATFATLNNLFTSKNVTVYDFIAKRLRGVEYIMYASPAGDIFMEPELYDFHPLDFHGKIGRESIVLKQGSLRFRTTSSESGTAITIADNAYFFNTKINHPFFITEKDRLRVTQTFDYKLIHTDIRVKGGQTRGGGILDVIDDVTSNMATDLSMGSSSRGKVPSSDFNMGSYIADGFQQSLDKGSPVYKAREKFDDLKAIFDKAAIQFLVSQYGGKTVSALATDYKTLVYGMPKTDPFYPLFGEDADRLTAQLNQVFGTPDPKNPKSRPSSSELDVVLEMFSSLSSHKNQTVSSLTSTIVSKNASPSKKDSNQSLEKSAIQKYGGFKDTDLEAYLNALSGISVNDSTGVLAALVRMAGPLMTKSSNQGDVSMTKELCQVKKEWDDLGGRTDLIRTQEDEKKAAQRGVYVPSEDMVKLYGYNPSDLISNPYIENKSEANDYARTVFNRLKGKAFMLKVDTIGRPEYCLNRPYYCERKDSIGLLTEYSITYSHGSDFSSAVNLEYVRKNSLTYDYMMGFLDPVVPSETNTRFKVEADYYYKLNRLATTQGNKAIGELTKLASGSNPGLLRSLAGSATSNVAGSLFGSVTPLGGIFVAHNRIGHIPFDSRFGENSATESAITPMSLSGGKKNAKAKSPALQELYDLATYIKECLSSIDDIEKKKLVDENKKLTQYQKEEEQAKQKVQDLLSKMEGKSGDELMKIRKEYVSAKLALTKKSSEVQAQNIVIRNVTSQKNSFYIKLYGYPEAPSGSLTDITVRAYNTMHGYGGSDKSMPIEEAEKRSKGYFYQILSRHYNAYKGDTIKAISDLELTSSPTAAQNKKFEGIGTIPYYVIEKSTPTG